MSVGFSPAQTDNHSDSHDVTTTTGIDTASFNQMLSKQADAFSRMNSDNYAAMAETNAANSGVLQRQYEALAAVANKAQEQAGRFGEALAGIASNTVSNTMGFLSSVIPAAA